MTCRNKQISKRLITKCDGTPQCVEQYDEKLPHETFCISLQLSNISSFVQSQPWVYSGPLPGRCFAQTTRAADPSASKPIVAAFLARAVLTATAAMARADAHPILTIGFRLGCSVMNPVIGGLIL
jgi:hypothetical protein